MEIKDSVVMITGAALRVGHTIALHLAQRGAHIAFSYYQDNEPWEEAKAEIEACGVNVMARQLEVRSAQQIDAFVKDVIAEFGHIDVLINNAAVWLKNDFLNISEQEWDLALDINLKGPFLTSSKVAPHMLVQGNGVIINITDLSAFQVWPGYAHHAASKAGLVALTKAMAVELAPCVRVNAIAPGTVLLPEDAPPAKKQWAVDRSCLKRVGSPEDVARMVSFLVESDFTTGAVYFVDGGRSLV